MVQLIKINGDPRYLGPHRRGGYPFPDVQREPSLYTKLFNWKCKEEEEDVPRPPHYNLPSYFVACFRFLFHSFKSSTKYLSKHTSIQFHLLPYFKYKGAINNLQAHTLTHTRTHTAMHVCTCTSFNMVRKQASKMQALEKEGIMIAKRGQYDKTNIFHNGFVNSFRGLIFFL